MMTTCSGEPGRPHTVHFVALTENLDSWVMAHRRLKRYHDEICKILDASPDNTLLSLSMSLCCEGIIETSTKQSVKRKKGLDGADELMSVITTVVRNNPSKLGTVLDCMEKEDVLEDIVKSIRGATVEEMQGNEANGDLKQSGKRDGLIAQAKPVNPVVPNETNNELILENIDDSQTIVEPEPSYIEEHNIPNHQPADRKMQKNLERFSKQVDIIIQTVNDNEKWAVLKYMEPPEFKPGKPLTDKPIDLYEPNWITLGMFGGYKCAMIQTEMGVDCRREVEKALEEFPRAQIVLAIGVAFACDSKKLKLGDVLVSKVIDGVGNVKYTKDGLIIYRASLTRLHHVSQKLKNVFARGVGSWNTAEGGFKCNTEGRKSKVHPGVITSSSALIDNQEVRDKIVSITPEVKGGEMEGVTLVEIQQSQAEGNKSTPPRNLDVIVIKGVADYGDGKKVFGKKWQYTSALAATDYANHKLMSTGGNLFIIKHTSCWTSFVKLISSNGIIAMIIVLLTGIFFGIIFMHYLY